MSTYVIGDIHGHIDLYHKMLRKIHFTDDDEMYIIGDVIDKGPEPIKLLLEIMTTPNVHFLLGNHEDMMLDALQENDYMLWYGNGGYITDDAFERLSQIEQAAVIRCLEKAPLYKELEVNGQKFYLAHAGYKGSRDDILWERNEFIPPEDTIAITGHTITKSRGKNCTIYKKGRYYDIDCGCAGIIYGLENGKLACIRLDDMKRFYAQYTQKELLKFKKGEDNE